MSKLISLSNRISYIQATENPLSADIGIVCGNFYVWVYDVGNSEEALMLAKRTISELNKPARVVISHFHPDHMGNVDKLEYDSLFVGNNTYKYTGTGIAVDKPLSFDDGVSVKIYPFPSSHAKGSLAMEIDKEYLFLGDALYPTQKGGKRCVNAGLLREQIKILTNCEASKLLLSHKPGLLSEKKEVLSGLEDMLKTSKGNEPYIYL